MHIKSLYVGFKRAGNLIYLIIVVPKISVAGSGLIVMGLYTVLWGKKKEMITLANDFKAKHIEEFDITKLENGDIEFVKNEK